MATSRSYLGIERHQPHRPHHRIDPVGAGALLVSALGLIATILLLKPYTPTSDHAYTGVGSMRTREAWCGDWLVTCAAPWICVLAVSLMIGGLLNAALIGTFSTSQTATWVSATSATANSDHADTAVTCDTSTGRMLYVAALNDCLPAEW
jgi:hypothetical protein